MGESNCINTAARCISEWKDAARPSTQVESLDWISRTSVDICASVKVTRQEIWQEGRTVDVKSVVSVRSGRARVETILICTTAYEHWRLHHCNTLVHQSSASVDIYYFRKIHLILWPALIYKYTLETYNWQFKLRQKSHVQISGEDIKIEAKLIPLFLCFTVVMHRVTVLHNEVLCSWCQIAAKMVNVQISVGSRRVCMKQKT